MLGKILQHGKRQSNKKGDIIYLLNEQLSLSPYDLLEIFESHNIARKKLRNELSLFINQINRHKNNADFKHVSKAFNQRLIDV